MTLNFPISLSALRAFLVAAKKGSFTVASQQLSLTQSAISQRISLLEDQIGTSLFRRVKKGVELTEEGRKLYVAVEGAFNLIDKAISQLSESDREGPISIGMIPSFAMKWFIPHSGAFQHQHPEIPLHIRTINKMVVDPDTENLDMSIALARLSDFSDHVHAEPILAEQRFAVCSPDYIKYSKTIGKPLESPEDLRHHHLLQDVTDRPGDLGLDWLSWLKELNVTGVDLEGATTFEQSDLALQAAISGQGVAITRTSLATSDMKSGLLVDPFDIRLDCVACYHLLVPKQDMEKPKISIFREWLLQKVATEEPNLIPSKRKARTSSKKTLQ